jgi:tetratricopeptide (TPR) repeat protein
MLRLWVVSRASRAAIDVSLAACALAVEDWAGALAQLDRVDQESLGEAARAAWLNNRAYALARGGHDPQVALACSDEAIALRPDVAGFRHTRGVALLALGRVDEAITELERLWEELAGEAGDEVPLLEAERCYDLGLAWKHKGEGDYAVDYFQRAHRASPGSRWAERAAQYLDSPPAAWTVIAPGLAELLDA